MSRKYLAGVAEYRYPGLGDPLPPGGSDVLLLTRGGICVRGPWTSDGRYMAWAPMPRRDKEREQQLRAVEATDEEAA
jgi:hypothetical protein